jgi:hypothetical protein
MTCLLNVINLKIRFTCLSQGISLNNYDIRAGCEGDVGKAESSIGSLQIV